MPATIDYKALTGIQVGDWVVMPIVKSGSATFHEIQAEKSGDGEIILRVPGSTSAIVVGDRFFMTYSMEIIGNRAGHTLWQVQFSRASAQNPFDDWEFTFWVRGEKTVCHGRARTEQRAMWGAVEEYRKKHGLNENKQLPLMKSFHRKDPGYDYQSRKL